MKKNHWYYEKIIKEAELREKWLKNIPVTEKEIEEMLYIDKHVQAER